MSTDINQVVTKSDKFHRSSAADKKTIHKHIPHTEYKYSQFQIVCNTEVEWLILRQDADTGSGDKRDKDVCDAGDHDLNDVDVHLVMDLLPSSGTTFSKLQNSQWCYATLCTNMHLPQCSGVCNW